MPSDLLNTLALIPAQTQVLQARQPLFHQGDAAQYLYAIDAGSVQLTRYLSNGKTVLLHTARVDETFAEAALFSDVYHCNAATETGARVRKYRKQDVLDALRREPARLLDYTAHLSRQVQKLRAQVELLGIHSARERIMRFLILEADPASLVFDVRTSLKDIAARLGLAHETLYRELAQLEADKVVARADKLIKILKPDDMTRVIGDARRER